MCSSDLIFVPDPGEIGQEVEEDEDEDAKPLKKNLKPGQK